MQAVIYARSSGTPEFDQRSIRAQVTSAQRYAETNGLIVQRVFIDKGTGRQRPMLAQAVDQVSSGEAEILLVVDVTRISRCPAELAMYLAKMQGHGSITITSLGINTASESGKFFAICLADFHKLTTTHGNHRHD